mgnify:CR=1 FL=1
MIGSGTRNRCGKRSSREKTTLTGPRNDDCHEQGNARPAAPSDTALPDHCRDCHGHLHRADRDLTSRISPASSQGIWSRSVCHACSDSPSRSTVRSRCESYRGRGSTCKDVHMRAAAGDSKLEPLNAKDVSVRLDLLPLLSGKWSIRRLKVTDAEALRVAAARLAVRLASCA